MLNLFKKKPESNYLDVFVNGLETLFPDEPYVLNGHWSWAKTVIHIVYPELYLFDKKINRWVSTGMAFHLSDEQDLKTTQQIFNACQKNEVPLLMIDKHKIPELKELIRRIESVFEHKLTVPVVQKPRE